ncbi:MAG: hypothetical protein AB7P12_16425 [Alphaproteobacteria bacterium]
MAWFRNEYRCYRCSCEWEDDWSAQCDDDCPECGARHSSPVASEDLTTIVRERNNIFVVYYSPDDAEDRPRYKIVGRFLTSDLAKAFAAVYEPDQIALCA